MDVMKQRAAGKDLLVMAEAVVAGRRAGETRAVTIADNPFDEVAEHQRYLAWRRGFCIGRDPGD